MKTGYFAKLKDYKYPVSICGKAPEFYKGPQFKILAPKWWFFKEFKDENSPNHNNIEFYIENFNKEVLGPLTQEFVVEKIKSFYPEVDESEITLVCYEKPGDFCHRHIVANWLTEGGFPTSEW